MSWETKQEEGGEQHAGEGPQVGVGPHLQVKLAPIHRNDSDEISDVRSSSDPDN